MADFINEPRTGMYFKASKDGPLIVIVDGVAVGECTGDTGAIIGMLWRQGQPSPTVDVEDEYFSAAKDGALFAVVLILLTWCGLSLARHIHATDKK